MSREERKKRREQKRKKEKKSIRQSIVNENVEFNDGYSPKWIFLLLIIVAIVTFIGWKYASKGAFHYDDLHHIIDAKMLNKTPTWKDIFGPRWANGPTWGYRPLLSLTYFAEKKLWGFHPGIMRAINILLHLGNALLLLLIMSRVNRAKTLATTSLFLLAVFFALHPVPWHSVMYVSARSTLLVSHLILWTVYLYSFPGKIKALALVTLILSFYTKEIGVLAVPLAFLIFPDELKRLYNLHIKTLSLNKKYIIYGAIVFAPLITIYKLAPLIAELMKALSNSQRLPHPVSNYVMTQIHTMAKYIELIVFPLRWSFTHDVRLILNVNFLHLVSFVLFFAFIVWGFRKLKGIGNSRWHFLAFFITFAPEFFYPRELLATEQRIYLGLGILVVFISSIVRHFHVHEVKLPKVSSKLVWVVIFAILTFNFSQVIERAKLYGQGREAIVRRDIKLNPTHIESNKVFGYTFAERKEWKDAAKQLKYTLAQLEPYNKRSKWFSTQYAEVFAAYFGALVNIHDYKTAGELAEVCELKGVGLHTCTLLKTQVLTNKKRYQEALKTIQAANKKDPLVRLEIMRIYLLSRNFERAWAEMKKYYKEYPNDLRVIRFMLNLLRDRKQYQEGLKLSNEAVAKFNKINPAISKIFQGYRTEFQKLLKN